MMMMHVMASSGTQPVLLGIVTALAAIFGVALALARWPSDKRKQYADESAVVITQQQGAATLINDVAQTLHAEIERKDHIIEQLERRVEAQDALVSSLKAELDAQKPSG